MDYHELDRSFLHLRRQFHYYLCMPLSNRHRHKYFLVKICEDQRQGFHHYQQIVQPQLRETKQDNQHSKMKNVQLLRRHKAFWFLFLKLFLQVLSALLRSRFHLVKFQALLLESIHLLFRHNTTSELQLNLWFH